MYTCSERAGGEADDIVQKSNDPRLLRLEVPQPT